MEKFLIALGVILGLIFTYFNFVCPTRPDYPCCPESDGNSQIEYVPVYIGSIEVAEIPKDSLIDYKDGAIAPRLERLYSEGKALLFHSSKMTGTILAIEKAYSRAADRAREEIAKFIETLVETVSGKIVDCSARGTLCREIYTNTARIFSKTIQTGTKVILKYRYFEKGVGWMCNVVVLYDPTLALEAILTSEKLRSTLEKAGMDPEEFVKEIEKAMNEVKSR